MDAIDARAEALFRRRFGSSPAAIGVAPGRVNLIGEHVDYAEGFVLPMAIDRSTAVAVRPTSGPTTIVSEGFSGEWSGMVHAELARVAEPARSWANYVLGPMVGLRAMGHALPNVECAVVSDVPAGGGVSSSAALEVATARAMLALGCNALDGLAVARLCQRAEHVFAGTPCGIMDMAVSANAREGHALLLDCRTLEMRHIPMPGEVDVLVIDSGVRHRLADGGYASRRRAVEAAAEALRVRTLRGATLEALEAADLDAVARRRARHVITEIARTVQAAEALVAGDVHRFGERMVESHRSLRDDFEVSIPELDCIVDGAIEAPGVVGARMTGGGFGGCAVVLVGRGQAEQVLERVRTAFGRRFGALGGAFVTRAAAGASAVRTGA